MSEQQPGQLAERRRQLERRGARLCARPGVALTAGDLDVAEWFVAWLADTGCPQCDRVAGLDLEPGQVASCGQHSYVRKGGPR